MRIFLTFAFISLFWSTSDAQTTGNLDLNGDWILNVKDSKVIDSIVSENVSRDYLVSKSRLLLRIIQKDPEIKFILLNRSSKAIESVSILNTDGREEKTKASVGVEKTTTTWQGEKLVMKRSRSGDEFPSLPSRKADNQVLIGAARDAGSEVRIEWTLSADEKRLTEIVKVTDRLRVKLREKDEIKETKRQIINIYERVVDK